MEVERPKIRNLLKSFARKRRRAADQESEVALEIDTSAYEGTPVIWSRRRFKKCHLYPTIRQEKRRNPRPPTQDKLQQAKDKASGFRKFTHGKVILRDTTNGGEVIAVIEFTPLDKLSPEEKNEINFVTTYLHQMKQFVHPIGPSRTWGGKMWGIGWRKSMTSLELFGQYVHGAAIKRAPKKYRELVSKSREVANILGKMFKDLGGVAFDSNQQIMHKNSIPSYGSTEFGKPLEAYNCAPHITFTTNGFFNPPHIDSGDASQWAFAIFVPTHVKDGSLASSKDGYDVNGGLFAFPDYDCCIDFEQQGLVKLIWAANRVKHCTLPANESPKFTRMGMSMQIPTKTATTCSAIRSGLIYLRKSYRSTMNTYIGGHRVIMNRLKL
ncbi:uncharacterized protein PGTG_20349 [Puccinia graminis f. sp. tritici CRL 75-36-700-3]|uniref:Tet-like 2OG-Fe(II) oxygenase domain-containing protein n=1 Tax=Puccinia graminis f. sp. tritici (strain CRL 75-36-700-3 / race SCCL) TaxID=418459 RepID=E3NXU4_PUCGT|nr:uncharacterized protein PGTG_20349 [Puccinia graminis f. sp. tritici CRL 75-36-700-3]EFP94393.2 hypothetical protein PGTG_20349 [Puccinia graminis f. sp. tritici CRL 75-36-700-3]